MKRMMFCNRCFFVISFFFEFKDVANGGCVEMVLKFYPIYPFRLFQVERVVDGGEPSAFKQYFSSWKVSPSYPARYLSHFDDSCSVLI